MTSKQIRIPKHCHHKGSNQGYVRLGGHAHYTGVWGLPETNDNYDRLIAEWLAAGRVRPSARHIREHYDSQTYGRAIARACIPPGPSASSLC